MNDQTGAQVRQRRVAIGMSVSALAKEAGVDRGSVTALEAGRSVRDTTEAQIDKTLTDLEHELGIDVPSVVTPIEFATRRCCASRSPTSTAPGR